MCVHSLIMHWQGNRMMGYKAKINIHEKAWLIPPRRWDKREGVEVFTFCAGAGHAVAGVCAHSANTPGCEIIPYPPQPVSCIPCTLDAGRYSICPESQHTPSRFAQNGRRCPLGQR